MEDEVGGVALGEGARHPPVALGRGEIASQRELLLELLFLELLARGEPDEFADIPELVALRGLRFEGVGAVQDFVGRGPGEALSAATVDEVGVFAHRLVRENLRPVRQARHVAPHRGHRAGIGEVARREEREGDQGKHAGQRGLPAYPRKRRWHEAEDRGQTDGREDRKRHGEPGEKAVCIAQERTRRPDGLEGATVFQEKNCEPQHQHTPEHAVLPPCSADAEHSEDAVSGRERAAFPKRIQKPERQRPERDRLGALVLRVVHVRVEVVHPVVEQPFVEAAFAEVEQRRDSARREQPGEARAKVEERACDEHRHDERARHAIALGEEHRRAGQRREQPALRGAAFRLHERPPAEHRGSAPYALRQIRHRAKADGVEQRMKQKRDAAHPRDAGGARGLPPENKREHSAAREVEQRHGVIGDQPRAEHRLEEPAHSPDRPAQIVEARLLPCDQAALVEVEGEAPIREIVAKPRLLQERQPDGEGDQHEGEEVGARFHFCRKGAATPSQSDSASSAM